MAQLNVTELDFDQIKTNLKDYFKNTDSPFKDWDYDGSGLNLLLDVLAYNTHYNAVLAHMSVNESFLDTAQVRSNVVSSAKLLGYLPYSTLAPYAYLDVAFLASSSGINVNNELQLPRGTKFRSTLDGVTYQYVVADSRDAQQVDGKYSFTDVKILQGAFTASRYSVDASVINQKFVIADPNVDITTLTVRVYANQTVSESVLYTRFNDFGATMNIDGESTIYFLNENALGNYEITFGNNVFGKNPDSLSVVELEYIVTQGAVSNGCSTFKFADSQLPFTTGTPNIVTTSSSFGGSARESLDSIRKNAPQSLIAQNRAVTADDYKAIIRSEFKSVDSISVWGGEYNEPPQYGKVFISIKPSGDSNAPATEENLYLTEDQKTQIISFLEPKRVLSITPILIDPEYTYLYFNIFFKYNPAITTLSKENLQSNVNAAIKQYEKDNLLAFDGIFRHSKFLSKIDNSNVAILNSSARVFAYKKITITPADFQSSVAFSFELYGKFNKDEPFIRSSVFTFDGMQCYIADEFDPTNSVARNIYVYRLSSSGNQIRVLQTVGSLDPTIGLINFTALKADSDTVVDIFVNPAADDIPVVRNHLLLIDFNKTTIVGDVDEIIAGGSNGAINYTTFNRDV
jgi:hypothetical protein